MVNSVIQRMRAQRRRNNIALLTAERDAARAYADKARREALEDASLMVETMPMPGCTSSFQRVAHGRDREMLAAAIRTLAASPAPQSAPSTARETILGDTRSLVERNMQAPSKAADLVTVESLCDLLEKQRLQMALTIMTRTNANNIDIARGVDAAEAVLARHGLTAEQADELNAAHIEQHSERHPIWAEAEDAAIDAMCEGWAEPAEDATLEIG